MVLFSDRMEGSENIRLEKLLEEGSFGIVYQITDIETNKKYALKRIDFCNHDSDRELAKKEADLLSNIRHEHILQYVESFEEEDSLFIVTEFCDRGDLEMYLEYKSRVKEKLPENKIAIWIYQISSGLHYLHERKILHRDLKTKNIFLMSDWGVRIGDLGIAKVLDLGQSKADSFVGTPCYMCPEMFEQKPYNNRSDIWSLGCCVFEMIALKKAFEGKAIFKIIQSVLSGQPPAIPAGYSSTLENLTYAMLQKDDFLRPTAFYIMNHQYIQSSLLQTDAFSDFDVDYDQEVAEKLKKKKIKSSYRTSGGSSGSGSSLTSWKNITNCIHEMEDEMRRFNEEKVHELLNSLELDKYKNFRKKKNKVVISPSNTLVENPDEEDSGTFIFRGTTKDESDSDEDQGTFVFKGTIKNSGDSGDEGTIVQRKEEGLSNGKTSSTGQNLKEDIVAATLLNRREVLNKEKKELSGDDLKHLLKKNPKDAAKQIVQGLKKSLSYDEQNTQEPEQTTVEKSHAKKKKGGFLKKEARKLSDPGTNQTTDTAYGTGQAVRLFPRKESHVPFERKVTTESLRGMTAMLSDPSNKTLVMEQIANLQRDIAQDIGEVQLSKCYDVMGKIDDDKVVQGVLRELLGPKKYEEYKEPLFYLRMFEMSEAAR